MTFGLNMQHKGLMSIGCGENLYFAKTMFFKLGTVCQLDRDVEPVSITWRISSDGVFFSVKLGKFHDIILQLLALTLHSLFLGLGCYLTLGRAIAILFSLIVT